MPARGKKAAVEPKGATGEVEDRSNENKATASTTRSTASFNAPSVQSILQDSLTKISLEYWAPGNAQKKPFSASIIEQIYSEEIGGSEAATSRLVLLELSFYLEKYVRNETWSFEVSWKPVESHLTWRLCFGSSLT